MGRQSKFIDQQQQLKDEICARLSTGEPLAQICRDPHMPASRTISDWTTNDPKFAADFARARLDGFDAIALEALRIADTPLEGMEVKETAEGTREIKRSDMLGHRRLQVETRLKLLAKWDPKRYGELIRQEVSGPDGAPLQIDGSTRRARVAQLMATAEARKAQAQAVEPNPDDFSDIV